jgi:hypothetical protein
MSRKKLLSPAGEFHDGYGWSERKALARRCSDKG